ncbi:anti-sigma-F factor Fin family protein [Oceanobacillus manasiensis]|uniref:anti-sigma-F factor Fin family protein n=1 Tax=Oceanobacillus manasiensis TaxID=586413 RepID=UPI0005A6D8DE|nr:anti-sigma-F factor Fin family protein [Oceanobacillus manasiensis]
MPIIYKCRHCTKEIGRLDQHVVESTMLGFDQLTTKEKEDMIKYNANGDMEIISICESCEDTLGHHPHYHELDFFIQ